MTPSGESGNGNGASRPLAVAYASGGFFALLIAGFLITSVLTGTEVVAVSGVSSMPGVIGAALGIGGFAVATAIALRFPHPSYVSSLGIVVGAFVGYLIGLAAGAIVVGVDLHTGWMLVTDFVTRPYVLVLLGAAFVSGWAAIALVRTRAHRPSWPWEHDDDDDAADGPR